jgi:hypothetical protein
MVVVVIDRASGVSPPAGELLCMAEGGEEEEDYGGGEGTSVFARGVGRRT